jgi:hypothetical protein
MSEEKNAMKMTSDKTNNGQSTADDPRRTVPGSAPPDLRTPERWLPLPDGTPGSDYPTPQVLLDGEEFVWDDDDLPHCNYVALARRLAAAGDLYRRPGYASGLLLAADRPNIEPIVIDKGNRLAAIIADRVRVRVRRAGNIKGNRIPSAHLNIMLASEVFLQAFRPVDAVVRSANYLPDFQLMRPGYNDGGPGNRLLYVGPEPRVERSPDAIMRFLDVMSFASEADRANAVGAALIVLLRHFWPGGKPLIAVTSTKSHGGKETVIQFAAGATPKFSVSYESADWALQKSLIAELKHSPDVGVVNVENARVGRGDKHIRSSFVERFLTDSAPLLYSPGTGAPMRVTNQLVVALSTNFGTISEDLLNRALPIHLAPVGDVATRRSPIGNPKLQYLPAHRDRIEAELRGMVQAWDEAGRPLADVDHPFTDCTRTIGGILAANGIKGFLANYSMRRTADDPERKAIGLLGSARPDEWLRASAWASVAVNVGVARVLISDYERDTDAGRARGIGVALSRHEDETFAVETEDERLVLKLEKARRRFGEAEATTRYSFAVLSREALPEDAVENSPA